MARVLSKTSARTGQKTASALGRASATPPARSAPATCCGETIRSWSSTTPGSSTSTRRRPNGRTSGSRCRSRLSTPLKSRCKRSRFRPIGRCAAWSTSPPRSRGRRVRLAPRAGLHRPSPALSFGKGSSSTRSIRSSVSTLIGFAGLSVTSRLRTSSAWSGTSAATHDTALLPPLRSALRGKHRRPRSMRGLRPSLRPRALPPEASASSKELGTLAEGESSGEAA
jgi:hypothetical protein